MHSPLTSPTYETTTPNFSTNQTPIEHDQNDYDIRHERACMLFKKNSFDTSIEIAQIFFWCISRTASDAPSRHFPVLVGAGPPLLQPPKLGAFKKRAHVPRTRSNGKAAHTHEAGLRRIPQGRLTGCPCSMRQPPEAPERVSSYRGSSFLRVD